MRVTLTRSALVVALFSLALLVAGFSFLLARSGNAAWTVPLPALGTYALLLMGIFLKGDGSPVARLIRAIIDGVKDRLWLAVVLALVLTASAISLGYYLTSTANRPDGELRFIVYDGNNIEGRRRQGMRMELEQLLGSGTTTAQSTNERGIAAFPVSIGDVVSVRLLRSDGRIYVLYPNRRITENHLLGLTDINVARIPDEAWVSQKVVDELGERVGRLTIDPAVLRWQEGAGTKLVGTTSALEAFTPLALPTAEIIIAREAFITGFSPVLKQPRWVASRISGLPPARRRRDMYRSDPLLPAEAQARSDDYAFNIFDRGHLVRRSDLGPQNSVSDERNYMTMITPQAKLTNRTLWLELEEYTSALKTPANEVYVLRGPAFVTNAGETQATVNVIGISRIPVPTHYFQVAVISANGRATYQCHLVPNTTQVGTAAPREVPTRFQSSLDVIERATGLRLFRDQQGPSRPCS